MRPRRLIIGAIAAFAIVTVADLPDVVGKPPPPPPPPPALWLAEGLADKPACRDGFAPFATESADFLTDGLVVLRDGEEVMTFHDGVFDETKPHPLWSASKSITATILGAAIQQKMKGPKKAPLSRETRLADVLGKARSKRKGPDEKTFTDITVGQLVEMTAGFAWEESYEGDVADSSVLKMLYLDGHADMAAYALDQPLAAAPGAEWNYSGGNINLVMDVLRRLSGEEYDDLPWRLLFDPLGMKGAVVERDGAGTFVGSSYVYMTPRDMARIGQLYLQDGMWDGARILPEGWVDAARTLSAPQMRADLGPDYTAYIDATGLFSEGAFWVNPRIPGLAAQFPNAPANMYFAAGHYGQLIIVLPTQRLVIARTGHDKEYWSRIDRLVTEALSCFAD